MPEVPYDAAVAANGSTILVGVVPGIAPSVINVAATFAERFGVKLVCASVDTTAHSITVSADGSVLAVPFDRDIEAEVADALRTDLRTMIAPILEGRSVEWCVRPLSGVPARELAQLGDDIDAAMIVVGTREPGIRGSWREFVHGSVAAQLAHHQRRPVLVVPLNPIGFDQE